MNRLLLALVAATALTLAGSAGALAQDGSGQVVTAKPAKTLQALTAADIDPIRLLPPPPADGSDRQKAELTELRHYQDTRGGGQLDQALWDDEHEDGTLFISVLGPKFDLATLPQTARLLAVVENDLAIAASAAKKAFHRHRPWTFDDNLVGCPRGATRCRPTLQGTPRSATPTPSCLRRLCLTTPPTSWRGPRSMQRAG